MKVRVGPSERFDALENRSLAYVLNSAFAHGKCLFKDLLMPRAKRYFIPGFVWHFTCALDGNGNRFTDPMC